MGNLRRIARTIRHLPGLERLDIVWDLARKPYHWLLNRQAPGVPIKVGGVASVRMPTEFCGQDWENYEPETVRAYTAWVCGNPDGVVLDVGSYTGIFSLVGLEASRSVDVIAFDSEIANLAAVARMCAHADQTRLRRICGFLGEKATEAVTLEEASRATAKALAELGDDKGTLRFVCLEHQADFRDIPCRSIDDLFRGLPARRALIKCDVEGAELLVLNGAREFLRTMRPDLLLSVHPSALPTHGHSVEQLRAFLDAADYRVECLAVDHEEHWRCEPRSATFT